MRTSRNQIQISLTPQRLVENTVPGEPQDVRVETVNSTAINVQWKPPQEKDRNGIIRGYHIHVQETREEVSGDSISIKRLN